MTRLDDPEEDAGQPALMTEANRTDVGPVPIGEVLPEVMAEIERRRRQREAAEKMRQLLD